MIAPDYARLMARYNAWQNGSVYGAAATLPDVERRRDRGAFFGSIHETLNHILWGDQMWLNRFAGTPRPVPQGVQQSRGYYARWDDLVREREAFDRVILDWAENLDAGWLESEMKWYSSAANREMTSPHWKLVVHLFNHQTHHRGQVHAMLTQAGAAPDDTDIPFLPADGEAR